MLHFQSIQVKNKLIFTLFESLIFYPLFLYRLLMCEKAKVLLYIFHSCVANYREISEMNSFSLPFTVARQRNSLLGGKACNYISVAKSRLVARLDTRDPTLVLSELIVFFFLFLFFFFVCRNRNYKLPRLNKPSVLMFWLFPR